MAFSQLEMLLSLGIGRRSALFCGARATIFVRLLHEHPCLPISESVYEGETRN